MALSDVFSLVMFIAIVLAICFMYYLVARSVFQMLVRFFRFLRYRK